MKTKKILALVFGATMICSTSMMEAGFDWSKFFNSTLWLARGYTKSACGFVLALTGSVAAAIGIGASPELIKNIADSLRRMQMQQQGAGVLESNVTVATQNFFGSYDESVRIITAATPLVRALMVVLGAGAVALGGALMYSGNTDVKTGWSGGQLPVEKKEAQAAC